MGGEQRRAEMYRNRMRARSRSSSSSSSVCPLLPARSSASRNLAISSAGLTAETQHQSQGQV